MHTTVTIENLIAVELYVTGCVAFTGMIHAWHMGLVTLHVSEPFRVHVRVFLINIFTILRTKVVARLRD